MAQSAASHSGITLRPMSSDDNGPSLSHSASFNLPQQHRRRHTETDNPYVFPLSVHRPKSASNLIATAQDFYGGDLLSTLTLGESIRARRGRDDILALADFLRNHPPPPDNFMSIPYGADAEERGRWAAKLMKIAKRTSRPISRVPQHLRLPDSAVSGITTGGHRHIAISIPLEASPIGDDADRSQYPVYSIHDAPPSPPTNLSRRSAPVRTFMNEKGVVTVLRPVTEVMEPPISISDDLQPNSPYAEPEASSQQPTNHKQSQSDASSGSGYKDYVGIHPGHTDIPMAGQNSSARNWSGQRHNTNGATQSPAFQRAAYPARGSSMLASRGATHPISIDGLLQSPTRTGLTSPTHQQKSDVGTAAISDEQPIIAKAMQARHYKSSPLLLKKGSFGDHSLTPTVLSDNTFGPRGDESRSSTRASSRNRRDLVRDKKKRDLEAARHKYSPKIGTSEAGSSISSTGIVTEGSRSDVGDRELHQARKQVSQPKLCPIMVVMDVEPTSFEPELQRPKTAPAPRTSKDNDSSRTASNPTPPMSSGVPTKDHSMDRTSLTRRREWNASRERERKKREALAAARTKAQQLASSGVSYERVTATQTDKDIIKLYEAFREHRFRDMERRVRRLERNGDIWLQALLPMLENMNNTMTAVEDEHTRDWVSDDEASAVEPRGRSPDRKSITKRTSLSHGRLLEKLIRKRDETPASWSETASASQADDLTGLGSIEPLMRELAGGARQRMVPHPLSFGEDVAVPTM